MAHNCRICLFEIENTPNKLINIFSLFDSSNTIAFNIEKFADIEIHINDDLPKTVCCECLKKLQECIEFKMEIQRANETLINEIKTKIETTEILIEVTNYIERNVDEIDKTEESDRNDEVNEIDDIPEDVELKIESPSQGIKKRLRNGKKLKQKTTTMKFRETPARRSKKKKLDKPFCLDCDEKVYRFPTISTHYERIHYKNDSSKYQEIYFHQKSPYCAKCDLVFDTMLPLKQHNLEEHEIKEEEMFTDQYKNNELPYCKRCNKKFRFLSSFRRHLAKTHGEKIVYGKFVKFDELPKMNAVTFNDEDKLLKHKCLLCNMRFRLERFLIDHRAKDHPEFAQKKENKCETCNEVFPTRTVLAEHQIIHLEGEDARPFVCEKCGKAFLHTHQLNKHFKRSHDTDSNVKCTTCLFVFRKNSKRGHACRKGYLCTECGGSFRTMDVLHKHMLIHSGEKPYDCGVCQKRFRQRSTLRTHMRVHSGERSFLCKECGRDFAYIQEIKNHIVRHHMGGKSDTENEDWKTFMQKKVDKAKVAVFKENTMSFLN